MDFNMHDGLAFQRFAAIDTIKATHPRLDLQMDRFKLASLMYKAGFAWQALEIENMNTETYNLLLEMYSGRYDRAIQV